MGGGQPAHVCVAIFPQQRNICRWWNIGFCQNDCGDWDGYCWQRHFDGCHRQCICGKSNTTSFCSSHTEYKFEVETPAVSTPEERASLHRRRCSCCVGFLNNASKAFKSRLDLCEKWQRKLTEFCEKSMDARTQVGGPFLHSLGLFVTMSCAPSTLPYHTISTKSLGATIYSRRRGLGCTFLKEKKI